MDIAIANRMVDFIFDSTGMQTIVCDSGANIIAANVKSRIGNHHSGAKRMITERLDHIIVTPEQEKATSGAIKAGVNMPVIYKGAVIGTFGISGDPVMSGPVAKIAAGLIAKELREADQNAALMEHASELGEAISGILGIVETVNTAQAHLTSRVQEVVELLQSSSNDLQTIDEVVITIQSVASNTQMLGLNAAIEAAHAGEHGRGFAIVAEAVQKLSAQSEDTAQSIQVTQGQVRNSMTKVIGYSGDLMVNARDQSAATSAIVSKVTDLKKVSDALLSMASSS